MAASFYIKQNDTAPSIEAALKNSNGRVKTMENASTVKFHMNDVYGNALVTAGLGTIVNAAKGIVAYEWVAGDTATLVSTAQNFK